MSTDKLYLAVAQDEPFMPVRMHFAIRKQKVYDFFQVHPSVDYDKKTGAFDWFYDESLKLKMPFDTSGVPRGHDLLLAQMKFVGKDRLIVICSSFKKTMTFLEFFSSQFKVKDLRIKELDMCNWVYEATEENQAMMPGFGFSYFEGKEITLLESDRFMRWVNKFQTEGLAYDEAVSKAMKLLEEEDKKPYPEFHKRKIAASKEDRNSVPLILMMMQRVALQRFADGDSTYTLSDAARDLDDDLFPEG